MGPNSGGTTTSATASHPGSDLSRTGGPVAHADLRFLADLARRMQWDGRTGADPAATDRENYVRDRIASGTLDALVWLLDVSDVAPATGRILTDRAGPGVDDEAAAAARLRADVEVSSPAYLYLGGVLDALEFAGGARDRFWWVPLPDGLRGGPLPRDEYGRSS